MNTRLPASSAFATATTMPRSLNGPVGWLGRAQSNPGPPRRARVPHRHRQAGVRDGAGGVGAFVCEKEPPQAERAADVVALDQRGRALVQVDLGSVRSDRQAFAIAS